MVWALSVVGARSLILVGEGSDGGEEGTVLYPPQVIPCGIHGRVDGLQKFQMDSMVFPHGFHTFSTWILSFSTWIPYGMSSWNHNSTLYINSNLNTGH